MFPFKMHTASFWLSKRFFVAILTFFGQLVSFFSISNVNLAVLEMTRSRSVTIDNQTIVHDPEFDWDSRTIGMILGATSYGSLFGIIAGYLALRFGGSTMITIGSLINSVASLLVPTAVHYGFYHFWIVEAMDGFGMQLQFASASELWSKWSSIEDRSTLTAIGLSGGYAGIIVAYPLCGFIMHRFGWPVSFYFSGGISLLWTMLWFFVVPNDPSDDKCVSQEELAHIKENREEVKSRKVAQVIKIYKNMVTSKVILTLCLAKFAHGIGLMAILTGLPIYLEDITNAEIDSIGFITSIPNTITVFILPISGYAIDTLRNKGFMTITQIHKLFIGTGLIGGSALLFVTAYYSSNLMISVISLTVFQLLLTLSVTPLISLPNYIAPSCAAIVACFNDTFFFLSAIIAPMIIGFVVTNHNTSEWSTCFCISGSLLLIGGVTFLIFASSEPLSWSQEGTDSKECQSSMENKNA